MESKSRFTDGAMRNGPQRIMMTLLYALSSLGVGALVDILALHGRIGVYLSGLLPW